MTCQGYDNLDESLRAYVQPEMFVGANKYRCDLCGVRTVWFYRGSRSLFGFLFFIAAAGHLSLDGFARFGT